MKRVIALVAMVAMSASMLACGGMPGTGGGSGDGGGGGGWKPDKCMSTQFTGDLTDAKVGQWMTYAMDANGTKMSYTVKVVGQDDAGWWVEWWADMGSMCYGHLWVVKDGKIAKAWAAAKGDKTWTECKVEEPPSGTGGNTDGPKPEMSEGDETKEVKAGSFSSHWICTKMDVSGSTMESKIWYSKDCWKLYMHSQHGGVVAMETSGAATSKTWLDAKGEDGKPTMDLPK